MLRKMIFSKYFMSGCLIRKFFKNYLEIYMFFSNLIFIFKEK